MKTPRALLVMSGFLFVAEGIAGVVAPQFFRWLVVQLQSPPFWPASVLLRAVLGILLLAPPHSTRAPAAVRAVGAVTLLGAIGGAFATNLQALPRGPIWRLPAAVLAVAGVVVIRASRQTANGAPRRSSPPRGGG